jgi:hypothetical protein
MKSGNEKRRKNRASRPERPSFRHRRPLSVSSNIGDLDDLLAAELEVVAPHAMVLITRWVEDVNSRDRRDDE